MFPRGAVFRALRLSISATVVARAREKSSFADSTSKASPASPSFVEPSSKASHPPASGVKRRQAGVQAVDAFVKDDMVVGFGTGNTIYYAVERIGELIAEGKLKGVSVCAVNSVTERHCLDLQIPVVSFSNIDCEHPIDVMIDSVDEVDSELNVLKGSKGSLSRER